MNTMDHFDEPAEEPKPIKQIKYGEFTDIHFNMDPEILSVSPVRATTNDELIKHEAPLTIEVVFEQKFVVNDWIDDSSMFSNDPRYAVARNKFEAHALNELNFVPGAEFTVSMVWPNEQTLQIFFDEEDR